MLAIQNFYIDWFILPEFKQASHDNEISPF